MRSRNLLSFLLFNALILQCLHVAVAANYPYQAGTSKENPDWGFYIFFHWGDQNMEEMIAEKLFIDSRQDYFINYAPCRNTLYFCNKARGTDNFGKHLLCVYVPKAMAIAKNWTRGGYMHARGKDDFDKLHFSFFLPDDENLMKQKNVSLFDRNSFKRQLKRYPLRIAYKKELTKKVVSAQKKTEYQDLLNGFDQLARSPLSYGKDFCHKEKNYKRKTLTQPEKLSLTRDVLLEAINRYAYTSEKRKGYLEFLKEASQMLGVSLAFERSRFELSLSSIVLKDLDRSAALCAKLYKQNPDINKLVYFLALEKNFLPQYAQALEKSVRQKLLKEFEKCIIMSFLQTQSMDDIELLLVDDQKLALYADHVSFTCIPWAQRKELIEKNLYSLATKLEEVLNNDSLKKEFRDFISQLDAEKLEFSH